jgi:CheY-like chemotaxis protein
MLFVNDDPFLLFTYNEQLKDDFIVESAENGLQALQMVCSHPSDYYDVIVLDINMPIMDGFEACRRIYDHFKAAKLFDFRRIREEEDNLLSQSVNIVVKSAPLIKKPKLSKQQSLSLKCLLPSAKKVKINVKIIALTADESPAMVAEIQKHPFDYQCSRLSKEMIFSLIKRLELKRRKEKIGPVVPATPVVPSNNNLLSNE